MQPLVRDILQKTTQFFRDKGIETARLDSELLISAALGWERMKIYLNYDYPLSEDELTKCRDSVRRRSSGEPVAYILGRKDFYKHTFKVSPAVLIPRPETEQIVEDACAFLQALEAPQRIVDLGTGSGCIGLSLLAELPEAQLLAVDLSPEALEIARENAVSLEVNERAHFLESDASQLDSAHAMRLLGGSADAVVANPPYIAENDSNVDANVKRYEPKLALFSGDSGLRDVRAWSLTAAELLRPGGFCMFEIGYDQGRAALEIFAGSPSFRDARIVKDLAGHDRFISAFRSEAT